MSLASTQSDIEYPESDGKPMGETDIHRAWMIRLTDVLKRRFAGQRVYVGCNLFLYYVQGDPFNCCSPDVFVVKDCNPGPRRTFKVWEEGRTPEVVFEVTSRSTRREDDVHKPNTFAKIGVKELFLYDPTSEYLLPPLKGFRLVGEDRVPIEPDIRGALESKELGLRMWLEAGELILADATTGERLLTDTEAAEAAAEEAQSKLESAAREAEAAKRTAEAANRTARTAQQAEESARRAADDAQRLAAEAKAREEAARQQAESERARAEMAEEEVRRLREQLAKFQGPIDPT